MTRESRTPLRNLYFCERKRTHFSGISRFLPVEQAISTMATIAAVAAARCSPPTRRQLLTRRRLPFSVSFSSVAPHAAAAGFGWADALRVAGDGGRGDESDLSGYFRKVDICNRGMVSFSRAPHVRSRNCMRICESLICGCLRGDFTGQKGGVREVPGGGSSRGICPQGVSVTSTLKPYCAYHLRKKYFYQYFVLIFFSPPVCVVCEQPKDFIYLLVVYQCTLIIF